MTDVAEWQARRIDEAHRRLDQHQTDISALQTRAATSDANVANMKSDLADIKGGITWLNRLIIAAILAAVITFIVKGGLNVG